MQSYEQAAAYIAALTFEPVETARIWFRCIHDTNKEIPAHKYYGTLSEVWNTLCDYNNRGYGIFCNINVFAANVEDHNLSSVANIRCHVVDLDNPITAEINYQRAATSNPAPSFAVNTSPGKHHIYWSVQPYTGNDYCTIIQRKLRQVFDGDKSIVDASRVLRVPGFYHLKNPAQPYMVTCHALAGYGQQLPVQTLEAALQHVNVIDNAGGRHELGDPELAAPSLDWLRFALSHIDPNNLDRGEWISTTAAVKQAGWTLADEPTLRAIWDEWCERYHNNDAGENDKQWRSIRETEIGWNSIKRRAPVITAYEKFGFDKPAPAPMQPTTQPQQPVPGSTTDDDAERNALPDILSAEECKIWFKDCFFIERMGKILTRKGRFLDSTKFNGSDYGGKLFVITPDGKTTDEPWKAATRSTVWTIPKVDHTRFVPDQPRFAIIEDQLGRTGVNTYLPARIHSAAGDVTPWLRHIEFMLPLESDRQIFYSYLAHNLKYPGYKIPWAPLFQSAEGVGKGFIQEAIEGMLGEMYTYSPKAEELVKSGSTFNAWMRGKLMIVVNEIKVDERRELIEILKPMITDRRVEIQSKGIDQEMEDNPANWLFFSNYKDAIPVGQNGRRYAIFYSPIQKAQDLIDRGMNDDYFNALFQWLRNGGQSHINYWLLNYPIERGAIAMRAPDTSSMDEARRISRSAIEVAIHNAVDDGVAGFRGGFVSVLAVLKRLREAGIRQPTQATICRILEQMGYHDVGRAPRPYGVENHTERTQLYGLFPNMDVSLYGTLQGYG